MRSVGFGTVSPAVGLVFTSLSEFPEEDVVHHKVSLGYRFFIVAKGRCHLSMNGEERELSASDIVYLTPGQDYTTVFPRGEDCAYTNLCFDFFSSLNVISKNSINDYMLQLSGESFDTTRLVETVEFTDMPELGRSTVISGLSGALERFSELRKLYYSDGPVARVRLNAEFMALLADVAEYLTRLRSSRCSLAASLIVDYISRRADEKLTCKAVAEHFNYHPNYCNRIVREYTGLSLHDYIVSVKVRRADRLLLETELPITEIAYRLAFHDSSHFSSVYQAHTGMKPSERRKLFRAGELRKED